MKNLKLILIYFNTLKYLKKTQILYRILNYVEIKWISKKAKFELRELPEKWICSLQKYKSIIKINYFKFLNQVSFINLDTWTIKKKEKLWQYNLHYFNYLNTKEYGLVYKNNDLIKKWILANPPFFGVGWDRYPTSIRIVNWIKWVLLGNKLDSISLKSLYIQSRWLFKNPERHLLGNHYFSNLKALIFSGCFFHSSEANQWLLWSLKNINNQLQEQILNDGGHFERSPMYHALFLEDILDLINLANTFNVIDKTILEEWKRLVYIMMYWLKNMTHPDKEIAFFNDAAFGIANSFNELSKYASKINLDLSDLLQNNNIKKNVEVISLNDSGYIRLESKNAVAILDVAPLGPDYLPAHGHADTLSFEMSIFGERVIVNGGTSCYGNSNTRLKERQTSSHSTVQVDNKDSSEVWGSFRVANRAYPKDLSIKELNNQINVTCSHTGYVKHGKDIFHIRNWTIKNYQIDVNDRIKGEYSTAISRIIFHPNIIIKQIDKLNFNLTLSSGKKIKLQLFKGDGKIIKAKYAPEFGKVLDTKCLLIKIDNNYAHYKLIW